MVVPRAEVAKLPSELGFPRVMTRQSWPGVATRRSSATSAPWQHVSAGRTSASVGLACASDHDGALSHGFITQPVKMLERSSKMSKPPAISSSTARQISSSASRISGALA